MAGYILSNDKLRTELSKAKDGETAAKLLGQHLSKDGKKIAKEVKSFVESDDVQKNFKKAKSFAQKKFNEAQKSIEKMVKKGGKAATKAAKTGAKQVKTAFVQKRVDEKKKK